MVEVPAPPAVAKPVLAPMVAICWLLELQTTAPVRSTVDPDPVVPMARNCAVWLGTATDCALGMTAKEAMAPLDPDPPELPGTVMAQPAVIVPVKPLMLAVI